MPCLHAHAVTRSPAILAAALLTALSLCLVCTGCATPEQRVEQRRTRIAAAPITHIVLIELKDPTRTAELIEDCNRSLPGIESVKAYTCGAPLVTGRANVVADYSVGIYVAFEDDDGYREYVDHPAHVALAEKWRAAWKNVRIYDFLDDPKPPVPMPEPVNTTSPAPTPATPPAPAE